MVFSTKNIRLIYLDFSVVEYVLKKRFEKKIYDIVRT